MGKKIVTEKFASKTSENNSKNSERFISIAIDGPSGAGKSSLAKNLAEKLGYVYLDTGALYRTVGLYVFEKNIAGHEKEKIEMCIDNVCDTCENTGTDIINKNKIQIELTYSGGVQKVFLNGNDVSEKIRENHISKYASDVSKINKVREFLLTIQRETAEKNNVVMDGRDIGTVILPNADVKIFLTASLEKRAERRYKELAEKSNSTENINNIDYIGNIDYNKILKEIKERDNQDSTRDIAPLKPAEDAVILDNSDCDSPETTLEKALKIIKEALPYVSIR